MAVTFLTNEDREELERMIAEAGDNNSDSGENGNGLSTTAANLLIAILRNGVYSADQSANITALATELAVTEPEEPDVPGIPDEPDEPEITLSSISATYSGGDVAVGTAVTDLTGIVVTATYSDGSTATVTDYTLSGEIVEGSNTITVSYGGKTTTFTITGAAESGGEDIPADATRLAYIESTGTQYIDTGVKIAFLSGADFTVDIDANVGSQADIFGAYDGTYTAYFRYYQNATVGKFGWVGGPSNFTCADLLGESMRFRVRNASYTKDAPGVTTYLHKGDSDTKTVSSSASDTTLACTANLYLFARNHNGTASNFASYKLREFVVYGDYRCTSEILHLIPVLDPNGVACLYDTVGKQYLRNSGTGDFTAGVVV